MITLNNGSASYGWLLDQIAKAAEVAAELSIGWRAELGDAASDVLIDACESAIGTPLSPTHREFLRLHDGAHFVISLPFHDFELPIGISPPYSYDVRILSCLEIIATTQRTRAFLEEFFSGIVADPPLTSAIVIARYEHSGDKCLADPTNVADGEYAILDAFHEAPDDWASAVIARSFREWLERMLAAFISEQKLLYYWMPTRIDEITPKD